MVKIKPKKIYVVIMYRWGYRECHHYILGTFSTKARAIKEAIKEKEYRGNTKYYPEIFEYELNKKKNGQVVYKLKQNPHFHPIN